MNAAKEAAPLQAMRRGEHKSGRSNNQNFKQQQVAKTNCDLFDSNENYDCWDNIRSVFDG